jgi:predicted phage terminase large subunit-like protein
MDEWQSTLYTRLHPGGAVIIVLTRWHEDDLAGRLLRAEPDAWEVISMPAEAEENDLLGREAGEALWPEHGFDKEWIEETKRAVGSQAWASLYQQRPSPELGSIFNRNWWKFYRNPPVFQEIIQSWDCTFKDNKESDFVVGQVWGRAGADFYLLDQIRAQMDIVGTMNAIKTLSAKHPKSRTKLIEDKANGPAVIQMLKNKVPGLIAVNPEGGKIVRAQAVSPFIESGNVYLPDSSIAPWIHDYIEEFAVFPNGLNDDCVDSTTQALIRLSSRKEPDIF